MNTNFILVHRSAGLSSAICHHIHIASQPQLQHVFSQHCFSFSSCCVWCHPLTRSGNAPSDSLHTPHRTRLLKMPLFPMVTFWQHTDMSWPHPIFWFPWVNLHRVLYEYNFVCLFFVLFLFCFCFVFLFCFFAGKHGFRVEINHAVHKKAQLLYWHTSTTRQKTRRVKKDVQAFPLSVSLGEWVRDGWRSSLWMLCIMAMFTFRGIKRNRY